MSKIFQARLIRSKNVLVPLVISLFGGWVVTILSLNSTGKPSPSQVNPFGCYRVPHGWPLRFDDAYYEVDRCHENRLSSIIHWPLFFGDVLIYAALLSVVSLGLNIIKQPNRGKA
jgi:hypothetical protein